MSSTDRLSYVIDRSDRIVSVNDAWASFAKYNAGTDLMPPAVLGSSLWAAIQDATTRELYRLLLRRVRDGTSDLAFRFRCDSPEYRRLLEMRIQCGPEERVAFSTTEVVVEKRSAVPLLDTTQSRSEAMLKVCSWCMLVRLPDERWVEVEQAVAELHLFSVARLPQISHGICPRCFEVMSAAIDTNDDAWPLHVIVGDLAIQR